MDSVGEEASPGLVTVSIPPGWKVRGVGQEVCVQPLRPVDPELRAMQSRWWRIGASGGRWARRKERRKQFHKASRWKGWHLSRNLWNTHPCFFYTVMWPKKVNETEEIL